MRSTYTSLDVEERIIKLVRMFMLNPGRRWNYEELYEELDFNSKYMLKKVLNIVDGVIGISSEWAGSAKYHYYTGNNKDVGRAIEKAVKAYKDTCKGRGGYQWGRPVVISKGEQRIECISFKEAAGIIGCNSTHLCCTDEKLGWKIERLTPKKNNVNTKSLCNKYRDYGEYGNWLALAHAILQIPEDLSIEPLIRKERHDAKRV